MHEVEVAGHAIAYRSAGSGPPLVFLHGFLCDSRCWRTQLEGLSDAFTVMAWDAPGAGASPDPAEDIAIGDWAGRLSGFLDALGVERTHVAGLSWGGMLAQELYRQDPDRVASLVLADTYAGWKGSLPAEAVAKRIERCNTESELPPDEFVKRWVPEFFTNAAPASLIEEMSGIVSEFHPRGFRLMARSLAETDTTAILPSIKAPTLVLWGDDDTRSPLQIAHAIRDAIPGAELSVIPNAGHVSNMERPDAFNERVRRFCSASAL